MTTKEPTMRQDDDTERRFRDQLKLQDLMFKRAMLAARKAGLERVVLGVVLDGTPIPPSYRRYDLSPPVMVTQSVAGECVDAGRSYGS